MTNRLGLFLLFLIVLIVAVMYCVKPDASQDSEQTSLYTSMPGKIRKLDPGDIGDTSSAKVAGQFFECLYQYHYLKRPYQLIPLVAESMPVISNDGLTYTIKVKKGVYFTDDPCFENGKGKELTAHDFIYAWKRIANLKYLSQNWWIFDGRIVGLNEFREYTKTCKTTADVDYSRPVEGLQTPDDYTLVITLTQPWPQLSYMLAHQPTAPVAREADDYYGKDIVSHPVGTGPYKLKVWNRGSYIEMVRNENYHEMYYPSEGEPGDKENGYLDDAGVRLPIVDRVVFMIMQEEQPAWLQFLRGKVDAKAIPKDNFAQVLNTSKELTPDMKQRNIHLKTFRDPSIYWLGFNMEDPVVGQNKPLRKAISYAIDRKKYIDLFWNDRDDIAYGFIPPMMKAYDPDVKNYGVGYDPDKAKEYVAKAIEQADGELPSLTLTMGGTGTFHRQTGKFYQRLLQDVGIDVELEFLDWPTFLNKTKTKSTQIFSLGWIADIPDTENFLQLFYTKNASPGTNNFNYSNPKFDKIYEQVVTMPDSPERTKLYRDAEKIVIGDAPAVYINHRIAYVLHHDWVLNYKPHVFQYGLAKYRRVDVEKREQYKQLIKKLR